jgi:hypothetical protein
MSNKLFRTLGFAALIVGVGKMFRFHAWKRAGGPEGKARFKHWHGPDGHGHPWAARHKKWHEGQTGPAEEDVDAGNAEAAV